MINNKVEEAAAEEAPVEAALVEAAPVDAALVEEAAIEEALVEEAPVEEAFIEEALIEEILENTVSKAVSGILIIILTGFCSSDNLQSWVYRASINQYIKSIN